MHCLPLFCAVAFVSSPAPRPVPQHTPGQGFDLHSRIPNRVFRMFSHGNIVEPVRSITLSASLKYNLSTVFVTDAAARSSLLQCGAVDAFNKLVPGAFKSDLLRCCLVWLHGGWYADLSGNFARDPRPLGLSHDLVVAADPGASGAYWNGFFGAVPRHPGLRAAIDQVIENVQSCFYGERDLAPTGPMLFGKVLQNYPKLTLKAHYHDEVLHVGDPELIHNKFPGYRAVYARMGYDKGRRSCGHLWNARRVHRHCN